MSDSDIERLTWHQIGVLVLILSAGLLSGSTLALPAPFLPKLNEKHGLSSDMTGWMMGVYSVGHLAVTPLVAKYTSKLGIYDMACWGVIFNACCTILFGAMQFVPFMKIGEMDWAYMILAMILRVFQGVGASVVDGSLCTMNSLAFPKRYMHTAQTYYSMSTSFGGMASPALAAGLYKIGGFMLVFAAVGVAELIVGILMLIWLPQTLHDKSVGENDKSISVWMILSNPRRTGALFVVVSTGILWTSLEPILEPELREKFGLRPEISSLCFVIMSAAYLISAFIVSKIFERWKIDSVLLMTIGLFVAAIGLLLAGPTPIFPQFYRPLWLLLLSVALIGIGNSILFVTTVCNIFPTGDDEVSNVATNSTISGLRVASYAFGALLGPVISGSLARATNFAWTTTFLAGITSLFLVQTLAIYLFTKQLIKRCLNRSKDKCSTMLLLNTFRRRKGYSTL